MAATPRVAIAPVRTASRMRSSSSVGLTRCVRGHWYIRGSGAIRSRARAERRPFSTPPVDGRPGRASPIGEATEPREPPLSLPGSGRLAARGGHAHGGEVTGRSAGPREEGRLVRIVAPQPRSCCIRPVSYTAVPLVAVETVLFRVAAACRRPLERGHSGSAAGAGLLSANSAGAPWLITAPRWPSWPQTTSSAARRPPLSARGQRRPSCRRGGVAWRTVGRPHPGPSPSDGGWRLIRTDRVRVSGRTVRADRPEWSVDLRWSDKHAAHGGDVQIITAPAGWPIGTFLLHHQHGRAT